MNLRQKRGPLRILVLLLIFAILVITSLLLFTGRKETHPSKVFRDSKLAYAKGVSFTEYRGEKKVYSVSIDTFSIERARLGPFAIGPLRVAHFNKVDLDFYLEAIESKEDNRNAGHSPEKEEFPELDNLLLNLREKLPAQLKKVRGMRLKDLSFNLWKNDKKICRIASDTAEFDRETRDLVFAGHATLDSGENGMLISHRIRWSRKTRLFLAEGSYRLTKNGEKREGTGIEVDYLFRRVNEMSFKK
jgi:hypothetical protein